MSIDLGTRGVNSTRGVLFYFSSRVPLQVTLSACLSVFLYRSICECMFILAPASEPPTIISLIYSFLNPPTPFHFFFFTLNFYRIFSIPRLLIQKKKIRKRKITTGFRVSGLVFVCEITAKKSYRRVNLGYEF